MDTYILGKRDVLVLRQHDKLAIRVTDGYVVGALGSVNWDGLEKTATQIIRAVSAILDLPEEALVIEEFSGLEVPRSMVGLVISAAPNPAGNLALEKVDIIRAVAQSYLQQLNKGSSSGQGELIEATTAELEPSIDQRAQERACADLAVVGGKTIKTPMVLEYGEGKLLLAGAFAAKPTLRRKPAERFDFVARVVGLNSHHKLASALVADGHEIELECDPDRFAHRLRDSIHTPQQFKFAVLRNFDGKGREQLVLIDAAEIEMPVPAPDCLI